MYSYIGVLVNSAQYIQIEKREPPNDGGLHPATPAEAYNTLIPDTHIHILGWKHLSLTHLHTYILGPCMADAYT